MRPRNIKSAGAGISIAKMETNCHVCGVEMQILAVTITDEGQYMPICESCKGKSLRKIQQLGQEFNTPKETKESEQC